MKRAPSFQQWRSGGKLSAPFPINTHELGRALGAGEAGAAFRLICLRGTSPDRENRQCFIAAFCGTYIGIVRLFQPMLRARGADLIKWPRSVLVNGSIRFQEQLHQSH